MIQEYSLSAPFPAQCQCQLAVMDWAPQTGGAPNIGKTIWINPGTLVATVYYDPAANTLRLAGSVSLTPPTGATLSFTENVIINSTPQSVTVTVQFSFPPVLFFDTGVQAITGAKAQFNPPAIPVSGLYTISAGNQTLSGVFHYSLQFPTSFTEIAQVTPTSLAISQIQARFANPGPTIVRGLAAPNGMVFNLVGGISDGTYFSCWLLNQATAQLRKAIAPPSNLKIG